MCDRGGAALSMGALLVGRNTKAGTYPIAIACFKAERGDMLQLTFKVR
jgi:hypothetical protein